MNWKRILLFFLLVWAVTLTVGFVIGFLGGFLRGVGFVSLGWLPLVQAVFMIVSLSYVFARLVRLQTERGILHACIVALLSWVSSFPLNVLLMKQPIAQWFIGAILAFGISIPLGAQVAKHKGSTSKRAVF